MILLATMVLSKVEKLPTADIIRITGFQGSYRDPMRVSQEVEGLPDSIFAKPTVLDNGTLVMVDGGETIVLFEENYHPMKIYLAKRSLSKIFLERGQESVHKFSKIPSVVHDELAEAIRRIHPSCWLPNDVRLSFSLSLRTEVNMKARSLFVALPLPVPPYKNSMLLMESLQAESSQQLDSENTMRNVTKDSELRSYPEVKIYGGTMTFAPQQRRLLDKFELWRKEQDVELDNTMRKALMSDKAWYPCAAISQSKTYAEMEKISPETAADLLKSVLKQSLREGYGNNTEAMKADFIKAPLAHSFTFKISFCLPDNSIGTIDYPAG